LDGWLLPAVLVGGLLVSLVVGPKTATAQTVTEIIPTSVAGFTGGVAVDSNGIVFLATGPDNRVLRRDANGVVTTILDSAGPPGLATFAGGSGMAMDSADSLFVVGLISYNLIKVTSAGVATEILDASGDGLGHSYFLPLDVAVDVNGNAFTVGGDGLFKVTPGGSKSFILEGGSTALVWEMRRVATDGAGNVYVSGASSDNVVKVTPAGVASVIIDETGDALGNTLSAPEGVAVDLLGNVYVAGFGSHNAFKITPAGTITEIIDTTGDGTNALLGTYAVTIASDQNIYVSGAGSDNVFRIDPGGTITQIMDASGDGAGAALDGPLEMATSPSGDRLYVAGLYSRNLFEIALAPAVPVLSPLAGFASAMLLFGCGARLLHRPRHKEVRR
jgi:hypothetical protein